MDCTIRVAKPKALISFAGYREADLGLCFRMWKKPVFSRRGLYILHSAILILCSLCLWDHHYYMIIK